MPAFFFQSLKLFWNALFGIANSFCFDFSFIYSVSSKTLSFHRCLQFWEKCQKKSAGLKSNEYGGWGMITVLFLAKNSRTSINVWADALSWSTIHNWFFHNSVRFQRIKDKVHWQNFYLKTSINSGENVYTCGGWWPDYIFSYELGITAKEYRWRKLIELKGDHISPMSIYFFVKSLVREHILTPRNYKLLFRF